MTAGLPNVVPAELDRSPDGRGRLSYQRSWSLFHEASGRQWTLHQLRHSALTYLGEEGVSAPLLMEKNTRISFHCYSDPVFAPPTAPVGV